MKKGLKLKKVVISDGIVTAYLTDTSMAKLSRAERNALADYKNENYCQIIEKLFGNKNIFDDDFVIIKNNKITYTLKK